MLHQRLIMAFSFIVLAFFNVFPQISPETYQKMNKISIETEKKDVRFAQI